MSEILDIETYIDMTTRAALAQDQAMQVQIFSSLDFLRIQNEDVIWPNQHVNSQLSVVCLDHKRSKLLRSILNTRWEITQLCSLRNEACGSYEEFQGDKRSSVYRSKNETITSCHLTHQAIDESIFFHYQRSTIDLFFLPIRDEFLFN